MILSIFKIIKHQIKFKFLFTIMTKENTFRTKFQRMIFHLPLNYILTTFQKTFNRFLLIIF